MTPATAAPAVPAAAPVRPIRTAGRLDALLEAAWALVEASDAIGDDVDARLLAGMDLTTRFGTAIEAVRALASDPEVVESLAARLRVEGAPVPVDPALARTIVAHNLGNIVALVRHDNALALAALLAAWSRPGVHVVAHRDGCWATSGGALLHPATFTSLEPAA